MRGLKGVFLIHGHLHHGCGSPGDFLIIPSTSHCLHGSLPFYRLTNISFINACGVRGICGGSEECASDSWTSSSWMRVSWRLSSSSLNLSLSAWITAILQDSHH